MSASKSKSRALLHRFLRPKSVQSDLRPLQPLQNGSDSTLSPVASQAPAHEASIKPFTNDDLWQKAMCQLSNPEKELLTSILDSNTQPDLLQAVADLTRQKNDDLQKSRSKLTVSFNGKNILLKDLLIKVLSWANKFKQIGDIVVNFDPVHLALPWAAIRFLLEALTLGNDQSVTILIGLEKVAYLTSRCKLYEYLYISKQQDETEAAQQASDNLAQALVLLYAHLLRFLALVCRLGSKSTISQGTHAIMHPDQVVSFLKQSDELSSRVESETRNCGAMISRLNASQSKDRDDRLHGLLAELEQPLLRIDGTLARMNENVEREERNKILHWISTIPYEDRHQTARADRLIGTGIWLLDSPQFIDWRESSDSTILWLHGSRKTKLVSNIVDCITDSQDSRPSDEAFLYFYCSRNQADGRDPGLVLSSLLRQLSMHDDLSLPTIIRDAYQEAYKKGFAASRLSYEQMQELFIQLTSAYAQVSIVIDAIDECDIRTRAKIMSTLENFVTHSEGLVKVLVSSRPDSDIKSRFEKHPDIELTAAINQEDISLFVNERMAEDAYWPSERFSDSLTEDVKSTLIQKSDGMFQWASLQLNELSELFRESDIRESLGKLPEGLSSTYDEIYNRIKSQKGSARIIADRAFQWIMASVEPVPPNMLAEVVCYDPESDVVPKIDLTFEDVRTACRNLLVLDKTQNVCKFSHLSVQEYLEEHHHNLILSNLVVSKTCLINLTHSEASKIGRQPLKVTPRGFNAANLGSYSRTCWPMHLGVAESLGFDERLAELTLKFFGMASSGFNGTSPYQKWAEFVKVASRPSRGELTNSFNLEQFLLLDPATNIALPICLFGIFGLVRKWWETAEIEVNQLNTRGYSLLWMASVGGHHQIVKELLLRGAEPGDDYNLGKSPLVAAAREGHIAVMELLTGRPNFISNSVEAADALCEASVYNQEASVRLLLGKGLSVSAMGSFNNSGWNSAVALGNESVIEVMLEYGADVNGFESHSDDEDNENNSYSSVLTSAIVSGEEIVTRMLLKRGADVEGRKGIEGLGGKVYLTPLQAAAGLGNRDIVLELLDRGADVNARSVSYANALEAALRGESTEVVTILVEKGVDITADFGNLASALHLAAGSGQAYAVDLLIEKGMDIDLDQGSLGTPLQTAAAAGREEVVDLLLQKGAKVNSAGGVHRSALEAASFEGYENIVRMILQQGVDLFVDNDQLPSALRCAIARGYVSIMELLISEMNNTGLQECIKSRQFLWDALNTKYPEVAKLVYFAGSELGTAPKFGLTQLHVEIDKVHIPFVESQADLMEIITRPIADKRGFTVLHGASISGSYELCQWLVSKCLHLDAKDNDFWTPLHWASYACRENIVDLLLDAGAQRDSKSRTGLTPYDLAKRKNNAALLAKLCPFEDLDTDSQPCLDPGVDGDMSAKEEDSPLAYCDSCDLVITDDVFHCTGCPLPPGFDLCFRCIKDAPLFHDGHAFTANWKYDRQMLETAL